MLISKVLAEVFIQQIPCIFLALEALYVERSIHLLLHYTGVYSAAISQTGGGVV